MAAKLRIKDVYVYYFQRIMLYLSMQTLYLLENAPMPLRKHLCFNVLRNGLFHVLKQPV